MVPNMQLVKDFCETEGLSFCNINKNENLLQVEYLSKSYFFTYTTTPFNREDVQHICNDKFLTYELILLSGLMPKTKKYLRPDLNPSWHDTIDFSSEVEIIVDIKKNFSFPLILKMNAGSLGRNVFKCENDEDLKIAVTKIFTEDWALLAQDLIYKEKEFRIMIVNNSVELAYYKGGGEFFYKGDKIFEEIKNFLAPLNKYINLGWAGIDIIYDTNGKFWLIEINTKPSLVSAIRANKKEVVKLLYKKAFSEILGA